MRAFVLGGGGNRGAYEVGMLEALFEQGITPDVVVGTSIGAINGAAVAADPTLAGAHELADKWLDEQDNPLEISIWTTVQTAVRTRTHIVSAKPAERFVRSIVGVETFEELAIPFECVAACIETAQETWFSSGPLIDPILASAALPGVFPPRRIGDLHYLDGGIVNSIPVERAMAMGATELWVLQVGHVDEPLQAPTNPFDLAMVTFEVSRRHRFLGEIAAVPEHIDVHVLPTGEEGQGRYNDPAKLRFADTSAVKRRIESARQASLDYIKSL